MFVGNFMTRTLITAREDERAGPALQRMREEGVRRMPVLNSEGELTGIVTDQRLLRALAVPTRRGQQRKAVQESPKLTVADVMNRERFTTSPDTPLETAAALMAEHRIGSLVVMDKGQPVGIITETDMFRVFLRLLIGDEPGLRVTVRAPSFTGILSDVTAALGRAGGRLLSLGTLNEGDDLVISFKVADLTRQDLEDLLNELPVTEIDIR